MNYHYPITKTRPSIIQFDKNQIITDELCDTIYISSQLQTDELYYSFDQVIVAKAIKMAFSGICDVIELENTHDIWARDYMPVQITTDRFWNYIFNPNYLQSKTNRPHITNFVDVRLDIRNPFYETTQKSNIIADGGNIVKCDGYVIMTDKVFIEAKNIAQDLSWVDLRRELGVDVVVIPREPTDRLGHACKMVRYAGPNRVLFRAPRDENDKQFLSGVIQQFKRQKPDVEVLQLDFSTVKKTNENNWCYIDFLRIRNQILVPLLSEENINTFELEVVEEDDIALEQLHKIFPQCTILGVSMRNLIEKGIGGLNSLAWTIKSFPTENVTPR
ncbi:MAG: agmatine deiminase family protein [Muribaculaceae bacterium]|nr:agmatine deiminase family protein [Muribaculaceae bacterium]